MINLLILKNQFKNKSINKIEVESRSGGEYGRYLEVEMNAVLILV